MSKKKKDIRRLKTLPPMMTIVPFIMKHRNESCNMMHDKINVVKLEKYIKEKQKTTDMKNLTMMHVILAAYCRLVSQRPALNRFIRGQRIYTRRSIDISLTIKREMDIHAPDTCIKVRLYPESTLEDVYNAINNAVEDYRSNPGGGVDDTAKILSYIPSIILRGVMGILYFLDYFRLLPKFLEWISPFHCSLYITSMGSLGIPAIYHHLYDFGTCPIFVAFGTKQRRYEVNPDGSVYKHQYIDMKFVLDERICDGFYYAKAIHLYKGIMNNPWQLDNPPEEVIEDVD